MAAKKALTKNSQISVHVVKMASTLPPSPVEDKQYDIVSYGERNDFPDFLVELSKVSSIHTAALDKKVKMTIGDGITYDGNEDPKTDAFIKKANKYESLNDVLLKCIWDLEIQGGYYLQVIWAKDKKSIAEIYHVPYETVRANKKNENGIIEKYYIKDKWDKWDKPTTKGVKEIEAYTGEFSSKPQLMACLKYSPANKYYSYPSYIGAIQDVDTMYQIVNFHNNSIRNNFSPGAIIVFRGPTPSNEEMDVIVKNIEKKYAGSNNAGTPMILFLDGEQEEPKIEQLETTNLDKLFDSLSNTAKENIALAHSMPRIVIGLEKPGSLGGSKEIVEANMIFYNEYIKKEQQFLLNYFNKITEINGMQELMILNENPSIILYSETLMEKVMSTNEIRGLFGFEPLDEAGQNEEGDVTIEEETPNTPE